MNPEPKRKILLVEDEPVVAVTTSAMLKRNGYDIVSVGNGHRAIDAVSSDSSIELILMDIDLGAGMSGPDAAREILKTHDIPIVFLTSHSEREMVYKVRAITRYGYVIKNSGDFVLLSSIEMAFELFESHKKLKDTSERLAASERSIRHKLDSILLPDSEVEPLALEDLVDVAMLQSISDDFYKISGMPIGIFNVKGDCLVATGWQDICTKFHRANPESLKCCLESDTLLTRGVGKGEIREYKCKNNMRDIVTPIIHGDRHVGNIFLGQFLYDDESPDIELFREQAKKYGYDEESYIEALERVPRWSREKVYTLLSYYLKIADVISQLTFNNIRLAKAVFERDNLNVQLSEKSELLEIITDNMVDLVSIMDTSLRFKYVSPSFERSLGHRIDDLLGKGVMEYVHPDDVDRIKKDIDNMMLNGSAKAEFRYRDRNGGYLWYEAKGNVIWDSERNVTGAIIGSREITDRKNAVQEILKSEKRYRDLFRSMTNGFVLHRIVFNESGEPVDFIHVDVNAAIEKLYGMRASDIIGRGVMELHPNLDYDWYMHGIKTARTGEIIEHEGFNRYFGRWLKIILYKPDNETLAMITEDITERKLAVDKLRDSEEKFSKAFFASPVMMGISEIDSGKYIEVNDCFCSMLGFVRDEVLGNTSVELGILQADARASMKDELESIGRINGRVLPVHKKNGEILYCSFNGEIITIGGSKKFLTIAENITDRIEADLKLKESSEIFSKSFQSGPLIMTLSDYETGIYVEVNDNFIGMSGFTREEAVGRSSLEIGLVRPDERKKIIDAVSSAGHVTDLELSFYRKNGEEMKSLFFGELLTISGRKLLLSIVQDITDRKFAADEREAAVEMIKLLNTSGNIDELMHSVILFFRNWSRCEAVAVRMRDGDDYPYFVVHGFPEEFVRHENSLCAKDINGQILKDDIGNPVLDCMCGNILQGRFDPSRPFFTPHGSFWSNCTTDLLASTTEADRQARTRNRCNSEGYESVALIPLKHESRVYGLIQLNDKRRGMFTPALIALFERLADSIAIALSQKVALKKLEESEARYKLLIEKSPLYVYLVRNGRYIFANPSGAKRLGYKSTDEVIGVSVEDTIMPESLEIIKRRISRAEEGFENQPVELTMRTPGGEIYTTESLSLPVTLDDGPAIMIIGRDITEEKRMQRELSEKEHLFTTYIESSPVGIYITDPSGDCIYANKGWLKMAGISFEHARGNGWMDALHPEDRVNIGEKWYESVKSGGSWGFEYRFKDPDGMVTWIYGTASPVYNSDGVLTGYLGFNLDITDQVITRELMRDGEEKFRTVADYTYDWEYWIGEDGVMRYVSPSCLNISGYSAEEFIENPGLIREIVYPEDRTSPCLENCGIPEHPSFNESEFRIKTKNGEVKWIAHTCRSVYDHNGKYAGRRGSNRDITARHEMEIELFKTYDRVESLWNISRLIDVDFKTICDGILDAITRITDSPYGFYGFINDNETEMTIHTWSGLAMADCSMADKPAVFILSECGIWAEAVRHRSELLMNNYEEAHPAKKGYPEGHVELKKLMVIPLIKDGRVIAVAAVANKAEDYTDHDALLVRTFISNAQAIVDRKKAEDIVRESERKLKVLMNATTDGALLIDKNGIVLEANRTLAERFGMSVEEIAGKDIYSMLPEDTARNRRVINDEVVSSGVPVHFTDQRGGLILESNVYPVFNSTGEVTSIAVFSRDVTDRKKAEDEIKALLEQKEMLLREVHHRIKNNMNTIAGLMKLQSLSIQEPAAIEALDDARSRVQNMMLIYDKLYRSADYKNLQVRDYFDNLINEIVKIFPNHGRVRIIKNIDDFRLDSKVLFTMGIMINELITNSFKYAFDGTDDPELVFSLKTENNRIFFSVKDNGKGLPEKIKNGEREGFGLNLVSSLAEQLEGEMKIVDGPGTEINVAFSL